MKTSIKILLLLLALAGAVFGVLYWQKTQVEPPQNPSPDNDNYKQLVNHVKAINDGGDLDKAFDRVYDELCFLKNEELIDAAQRDEQLRLMADAYAPQFASNALAALRNTWTYADLNRLNNRAKLLSSLTSTEGDKVIVDTDVTSKLSAINKVNSDYSKANAVASNTAFRNESDAKNRISEANRYRSDAYLSHCPALVERLKGLPAKIGRSHFSKVSASVNSFARNYRNYSDVPAKKREIRKMISQYDGMTRYYGRNEGSSGLYSKLDNVPDPPYDL
jgi:hypothetical protein